MGYYDHGRGEVVVLLASFARSVSDFNELTAAVVGEGFRTLAVESRGIDQTAGGGPFAAGSLHDLAGDVLVVLRDAQIPEESRIHVIGHAFGSIVARTLASDHPERMRSVVLIAPGGQGPIERGSSAHSSSPTCPSFPGSSAGPRCDSPSSTTTMSPPSTGEQAGGSGAGWGRWRRSRPRAARHTRAREAPRCSSSRPRNDALAPARWSGELLAKAFPERVELVRIPSAAHALLPEQPERIREAVIPFLRAHSGERDAHTSQSPASQKRHEAG